MEHANDREELRRWVMEQTALLDPPEALRPDSATALARFHARLADPGDKPAWKWWTVAVSAAVAAGLACGFLYPIGKLAAQRLWQMRQVDRVAIIAVKPWPEGAPSPGVRAMAIRIPPLPARDLNDVTQRVGFTPRMPGAFVLSASPQFYTEFPVGAETAVNVADLDLALAKAGVSGLHAPKEWDGAKLALHTSSIAIAQWPDAVLLQSLPLTFTAPDNFDLAAYSALILQIHGVPPDEARRLAERAGTTPPWLVPFAAEEWFQSRRMALEEVRLNSGMATMLTQRKEDGTVERMGLFWSAPDRVYLLTGSINRELAISLANSIR